MVVDSDRENGPDVVDLQRGIEHGMQMNSQHGCMTAEDNEDDLVESWSVTHRQTEQIK